MGRLAQLHAVSWNLTARCNLQCEHCYLDAAGRAGATDLPTEMCLRIVRELAEVNPNLLLILTGGEPLLRPDLAEISSAAAATGMTVVVGTNGTLLDPRAAARLKQSGVSGVGVSIDSAPGSEGHDRLRGRAGSWQAAIESIRACEETGIDCLVQTSVFRWNRDDLAAVAELAADCGARAWNVYFLVCTGRGQDLTDLSPDEYEATLHEVRELQRTFADRLLVAVRCAPQYRRIVAEESEPSLAFHAYPSGCPAAIHYARIGPGGEVTPCPYMPSEAGTLREQRFADVWEHSPLFAQLRDRTALQGRCGSCTYRDTCGGCRARALAVLGDPMAEDPSCTWNPVARPAAPAPAPEPTFALADECTMPWTSEACQRLERVPSFVRGLVVRRVEAEAKARGAAEVTPEIMKDVRAQANPGGGLFARFRGPPAAEGPAAEAGPADTAPAGPATWTSEALARVENAPDFVRPGIRKLMALRAQQRGLTVIDSDFLSEIRDESMMRVSRIMRRFGLGELRSEAFAEARKRMARDDHKLLVIDQIEGFLRERSGENEEIRAKFQSFLDHAGERGRPWMPDASARVEKLPAFARPEARQAVEQEARRIKAPVVTRGVVDRVLGASEDN